MILAIDVGNSHVVLGSIEDGKILNVIRIKTDPKDTWAEYAIKIDQLFGIFGFDQSRLEGAVVASVVPPVTAAITEAVKKITGKESLVVGPGIKTGLNLRIDDPSDASVNFSFRPLHAYLCEKSCLLISNFFGTRTPLKKALYQP